MALTIREYAKTDQAGVEGLDTSFETETIFELSVRQRSLELIERKLSVPRQKRYPIEDAFAFWASWKDGWVAAEGGRIVGFAAVEYEAWHSRLVLWHLYVAPSSRRNGVGRSLMAAVENHARAVEASHVWLETSNVNVPGILAYERLGYALCGADQLYYRSLPYSDEQAIYLAKLISP